MSVAVPPNHLYFGDNLQVLRTDIAAESVDLIYLDPPFNSKRDYNLLFKSPKGHRSEAQITAFKDSWVWGIQAEEEFDQIVHQPNTDVSEIMQALRRFLGQSEVMAYLTMMANRLLELHRVLKSTGSFYLHCDPTASHYLKVVLDGVFGKTNFRSEISWKRSSAHNDAKQGRKKPGNVRDVIFFYTKSDDWTWNTQFTDYDANYAEEEYRHSMADGRKYKETDLTANKPGGDVSYVWRVRRQREGSGEWLADLDDEYSKPINGWDYLGVSPYRSRYWAYSKENLRAFAREGKLIHRSTGMPRLVQFADEMPGVALQNDWQDIPPALGSEYLGYPTQKPLALLDRIIRASSNPGDMVLDPFCGCGTAVHAAQNLNRNWIGIDITHLAISLIEKRLKDAFGGECPFAVHGTPKDPDSARNLAERDKYQFQWWAVSLVGAQPHQGKKKGADGGVDGIKYFHTAESEEAYKIVVGVKGGNLKADDVRSLNHVREREKAEIALLVTLHEPTKGMVADAASAGFFTGGGGAKYPRMQILTVGDLLSGTAAPRHPDVERGSTFKIAKRGKVKAKTLPGLE